LRRDHALVGDACARQAQHAAAAQAGDLQNQRGAGFRGDGGAFAQGIQLFMADLFVGHGKDCLLRLFNKRGAGVKTQVLVGDIVRQRARKPYRGIVIGQGEQHAGCRQ
ncbi:Methyltransferase, partial [Corchorus olitorius]